MARITSLQMTTKQIVVALGGGNPGGLRVCMDLLINTPQIDPENLFGGLGTLLNMDTQEIYEHRIWMLYKDVCGQHIGKMIAVIRACQLGIINQQTLNEAIDNRGLGLDVDDIVAKVKTQLKNFNVDA